MYICVLLINSPFFQNPKISFFMNINHTGTRSIYIKFLFKLMSKNIILYFNIFKKYLFFKLFMQVTYDEKPFVSYLKNSTRNSFI